MRLAQRIALLTLAGALAAAGATACGPAAAGPGAAGESAVPAGGEVGVAPAPEQGEPEVPEGPAEPSYPGTAQAYAEAVLAALDSDDWDWFGELTTPELFDQLIELPASVDDDWAFHRCDGAAGSAYCSFLNDDGDALAIRISNALLGQAHAATEAILDATEFPNDGKTYVQEFIAAWKFGNTVRMHLLSSASVVAKLPAAPTTAVTYPEPDCCGGGLLQVKAKWGNSTKIFDVGTTKLGGPNAILDYTVQFGITL
jgi:hypothetical protein